MPARWVVVCAMAAILLGVVFRYSNAVHKIYYQDEAVTSVRVAGYTLAEYNELFDRSPRRFGEIQRLLRPAPGRGVADAVRSLAAEDPQHPPAFYALESFWTRIVGSAPLPARLLPVVLSLAALPLMYWLSLELFGSRTVGWVATALLAVSPFFVLYAYQAREYGLLAAAILLSSVLFLRAERLGGWTRWIWYALSAAFGMYTYLLFAFVIAAHAVAAIVTAYRSPRTLLPFFASATGGVLLATPWLRIVLLNRGAAGEDLSWATSAYPLPFMVAKWAFFAGATFFDLEYVSGRLAIVTLIVLVVIIAAIVHLARSKNRTAAVFLAALAGTTFLGLAVPDLALHHRFSTIARYLTPTWLALVLAVAAFVGTRSRSWMAQATFLFLLAAACASNLVSSRSDSWWENNGNKGSPELAAQLEAHPGLLVVSSADAAPLLDLAPLVTSRARWLGYRSGATPPSSALTGEGQAYLLSPSDALRTRLGRDPRIALRLVYDSHDFSTNLTRFRSATTGQRAGTNDWGEIVLWAVDKRAVSAVLSP